MRRGPFPALILPAMALGAVLLAVPGAARAADDEVVLEWWGRCRLTVRFGGDDPRPETLDFVEEGRQLAGVTFHEVRGVLAGAEWWALGPEDVRYVFETGFDRERKVLTFRRVRPGEPKSETPMACERRGNALRVTRSDGAFTEYRFDGEIPGNAHVCEWLRIWNHNGLLPTAFWVLAERITGGRLESIFQRYPSGSLDGIRFQRRDGRLVGFESVGSLRSAEDLRAWLGGEEVDDSVTDRVTRYRLRENDRGATVEETDEYDDVDEIEITGRVHASRRAGPDPEGGGVEGWSGVVVPLKSGPIRRVRGDVVWYSQWIVYRKPERSQDLLFAYQTWKGEPDNPPRTAEEQLESVYGGGEIVGVAVTYEAMADLLTRLGHQRGKRPDHLGLMDGRVWDRDFEIGDAGD